MSHLHQYRRFQKNGYVEANELKYLSSSLIILLLASGNCHYNAVAESFFQLLKQERIKRRIYPDRKTAQVDIFNYIEMFYNRKRKHGYNDMLSPVEYERRYFMKLGSV